MKTGFRLKRIPWLEGLMLVAAVLFVSPCFLALMNSFKTLAEIIQAPLALPNRLDFESYAYVCAHLGQNSLLARYTGLAVAGPMVNSLFMCVAVILSLVTTGPMASYSLVRRRMATGRYLRVFFLAGLTIPFQIIMVPMLKQFRMLGIQFTYTALLLHYVSWGLPLCIFIYSGFMATIPKELEESAALDGCGPFRTFWQIVFPLLTPCTVTIIIFWGLWIWNDFMQAFIIVGPNAQLVFVQLWQFLGDKYVKNWNHIFAGAVLLSLPVTILYLLMQRRFIKGLTAGAIK